MILQASGPNRAGLWSQMRVSRQPIAVAINAWLKLELLMNPTYRPLMPMCRAHDY